LLIRVRIPGVATFGGCNWKDCLIASCSLATQPPPHQVVGAFDLSGDGLTTPLDALWVVNAINQSTPAAALPAADLNSDNQIDLADADLAMGLVAAAFQQNLATWSEETEIASMQNPHAALSGSQVDAPIGLFATVASLDAGSDQGGPAGPMFASSTDLNDA
jgi:hypothetical protein